MPTAAPTSPRVDEETLSQDDSTQGEEEDEGSDSSTDDIGESRFEVLMRAVRKAAGEYDCTFKVRAFRCSSAA